jgi:hypothetical protein
VAFEAGFGVMMLGAARSSQLPECGARADAQGREQRKGRDRAVLRRGRVGAAPRPAPKRRCAKPVRLSRNRDPGSR